MTTVKVDKHCAGLVKVTVDVDSHGNVTVTVKPITEA
jgi:hypothetical protein